MSDSQIYYKCICQNCAGHIEFPASAAGTSVPCPHCQFPTILEGPQPAAAPVKKSRSTLAISLAIALVLVGIAGWAIKSGRLRTLLKSNDKGQTPTTAKAPVPPPPAPDPWHGLKASPVGLIKADTGGLVYAVGTLRNDSDGVRYGVKVEIDLFDAQNAKIETTTDYISSIPAGKDWKFRALVLKHNAANAKLVKVTEEK